MSRPKRAQRESPRPDALRLVGYAEPAYHDHIQWRLQCLGDLKRHGNTASWESQHHHIVPAKVADQAGQLPPGIDSIRERLWSFPSAPDSPDLISMPSANADVRGVGPAAPRHRASQ